MPTACCMLNLVMRHSASTGHPIPIEHREALRRLVDHVGEVQAIELLGERSFLRDLSWVMPGGLLSMTKND